MKAWCSFILRPSSWCRATCAVSPMPANRHAAIQQLYSSTSKLRQFQKGDRDKDEERMRTAVRHPVALRSPRNKNDGKLSGPRSIRERAGWSTYSAGDTILLNLLRAGQIEAAITKMEQMLQKAHIPHERTVFQFFALLSRHGMYDILNNANIHLRDLGVPERDFQFNFLLSALQNSNSHPDIEVVISILRALEAQSLPITHNTLRPYICVLSRLDHVDEALEGFKQLTQLTRSDGKSDRFPMEPVLALVEALYRKDPSLILPFFEHCCPDLPQKVIQSAVRHSLECLHNHRKRLHEHHSEEDVVFTTGIIQWLQSKPDLKSEHVQKWMDVAMRILMGAGRWDLAAEVFDDHSIIPSDNSLAHRLICAMVLKDPGFIFQQIEGIKGRERCINSNLLSGLIEAMAGTGFDLSEVLDTLRYLLRHSPEAALFPSAFSEILKRVQHPGDLSQVLPVTKVFFEHLGRRDKIGTGKLLATDKQLRQSGELLERAIRRWLNPSTGLGRKGPFYAGQLVLTANQYLRSVLTIPPQLEKALLSKLDNSRNAKDQSLGRHLRTVLDPAL